TAGLEDSYGDSNTGVGVRLHPLDDAWFADLRTRLLLLLGAAGLVLFIACTNVANLLLARAVARRGELGLRLALGASRGGLVRQLVTETLLLMGLGVVAGLGLAQLSTRLLIAASAVELRSFVDTTVDFRVAGAMLVVALLCGLGFGLAPALMASRFAAGELLKVGGKSSPAAGRRGFQSALVIGQVALALVLLMAFGILIQSFRELQHTELGFDAGNLLTARVDLKGERYAENAGKVIFARQAAERLSALPEVRAAAVSGPDMPTDTWTGSRYTLEDRTVSTGDERVLLTYHSVSPGYFRVLGIPVLRGRVFTPQDTAATPSVAVVSREMAERYWPGESPIDKRFKFGHRDNSFPWFTVVGMVGNVRDRGLRGVERPGPTVYFSLDQLPPNWPPIL
ncbi:MAG: FtsX-like permease family protein, partial [bacterium]|nr:FtsX-like permease family protein [bacterium]